MKRYMLVLISSLLFAFVYLSPSETLADCKNIGVGYYYKGGMAYPLDTVEGLWSDFAKRGPFVSRTYSLCKLTDEDFVASIKNSCFGVNSIVNVKTGSTLLHTLVKVGTTDINKVCQGIEASLEKIKYAILSGANVDTKDAFGKTPVDYSKSYFDDSERLLRFCNDHWIKASTTHRKVCQNISERHSLRKSIMRMLFGID
jgi:hypothetical protein